MGEIAKRKKSVTTCPGLPYTVGNFPSMVSSMVRNCAVASDYICAVNSQSRALEILGYKLKRNILSTLKESYST